jgi:hypothetical protein
MDWREKEMYFEAGRQGGDKMSTCFAEIIEDVKSLSIQEKRELHQLIERYLIEARKRRNTPGLRSQPDGL